MITGLRRWPPTGAVTGLLLLVILLPPVMAFYGIASSMALGATMGGMLVCARVVGPSLPGLHRHLNTLLIPAAITALIGLLVLVHVLVVAQFLPIDFGRAVASLVPFAVVVFASFLLSRALAALSSTGARRAGQMCFGCMCCIGLAAYTGLSPRADFYKPVFPFNEPSFFATAFAPLLMFACVTGKPKSRMPLLLAGIVLGYLLENFTLLVGCGLVAAVCLRSTMIVLVTLLLGAAATQLDLSYYSGRLDLSAETENLSSLVYLQGWQLIPESLQTSSGFGLGFQQLGLAGTQVDSAAQIFAMVGGSPNVLDGSFLFSKISSEFGVMGLLFTAGFLVAAVHAGRALRRQCHDGERVHSAITFARCVVVCFLLDMFIRGNGYFAGSTILAGSAFWTLSAKSGRAVSFVPESKAAPDHAHQL